MTNVAGLEIKIASTGIDQAKHKLKDLEGQSRKVETATQRMERSFLSLKSVAVAAFTGWGIAALAKDIVAVSNSFTLYKQTLETLEGTHSKAVAKWDALLTFAEVTPFKIAQVMDSYKTLRAFGLEPTIKTMTILGDTAAALGGGDVLGRIALVLGQIQAQGRMTAQDMNQLANAGINAGKVMQEAFGASRDEVAKLAEQGIGAREIIEALLNEMSVKFGGQMEKLNKTLAGQWEELQSIWERFQVSIMDAGLDDYLTKTLVDLNKELGRLRASGEMEKWAKSIGTAVTDIARNIIDNKDDILGFFKDLGVAGKAIYNSLVPALKAASGALSGLVAVYNSVPKDVVAVGGAGLIGRILFGTQGAVVLAGLAAIDKLKVEPKSYEESSWATKKGVELLAWLNDVDLAVGKTAGSFVELYTAQGSIWVHKSDMDEYLNSLNGIDEASNTVSESTKDLGFISSGLKKEVAGVNKELEKYYKNLEASKKELDLFFRVELIPDTQLRNVEELKIKYEELEKQIYETFVGEDLKAQLANLSKWYGMEYEEIISATEDATDEMAELWTQAMDRVQSTLADTFHDAMKGELDSFEDVFDSFCDVLLRYWAEMAAAMTMKDMAKASQQGWGGFLGGIFGGQSPGSLPAAAGGGTGGGDGINQAVQAGQSAYSLYGAYGAYQGAGGGWAGAKAGAGSYFGGGSGLGGISVATWAAIAYMAESFAAQQNVKKGYGRIEGTPYGYGMYQPAGPWGGDIFNEPISTYGRGLIGQDEPTATGYQSLAMKEGDFGEWMKASLVASWDPLGLVESALGLLGINLGEIFGYSNKKRSYLGRDYTYGYDLDEGWGQTGMTQYKDEREGKKAFGEAADTLDSWIVDFLNNMESMTSGYLEKLNDNLANKFKIAMIDLGELGFNFYIGAEDKGEFEDDFAASFSKALDGVINPTVDIATDFMKEATEEAFTSPEIAGALNILRDNIAEFFEEDMATILEGFDMPLPTTQAEFETYIAALQDTVSGASAVIDYLTQIADITEEISKYPSRTALTQSIIEINANFDQLADTLESLGVDLDKYTDLERARGIALAEATYGFSADSIVNEFKRVMDLPSAQQAGQEFTLGFMEQVREGMVNSITSAFTEMIYAQMLAPLAETFLEGAETPEELLAAAQSYIKTVTELMRDPAMIEGLQGIGEMAWEIGQMVPDPAELAKPYEAAELAAVKMEHAGPLVEEALIRGGEAVESSLVRAANNLMNISNSPIAMASGGIVTRPTYSLTGEAGPEVVLPLNSQYHLTAKLDKSNQETVVTIPLTVVTENGKVLKQEIIKETFAEMKQRSRRREIVIHATGVA